MGAYQRVIDRRIVAHCRNRFAAARPPAKDHAPAGDAALGLLGQRGMTAYGTAETADEAFKRGAYDVVHKPFNMDDMTSLVNHALESSAR